MELTLGVATVLLFAPFIVVPCQKKIHSKTAEAIVAKQSIEVFEKQKAAVVSLVSKLEKARLKSNVETKIVVRSASRLNIGDTISELEKRFGRRPGFAVAAIDELRLLMIQADAETMAEVMKFIDARIWPC